MDAPTRLTDRKRQAILKAAAEQFRACGFDATSVDRIAAAAGVSKRTVYNHFPSKEELFTETLVQLFQSGARSMKSRSASVRILWASSSVNCSRKSTVLR
jgi:TetR/AcrR family transcriptional regulator of autoinduction and epiphytic fitness